MLNRLTTCAFGLWHRARAWLKPNRELAFLEKSSVGRKSETQILAELGRLYTRIKCPASAERCLRRYVAIRPKSAQIHAEIAQLCLTQDKYRQALREANRALKSDGNCLLAHLTMGVAHLRLGHWAEAVRSLKQAIWLSDENGESAGLHSVLAKAYYGLGDAVQADKHRSKAQELGLGQGPGWSEPPERGS